MMKHFFSLYIVSALLILTGCLNQHAGREGMNDKKIHDLIKQMTLEEKIGQMQQISGFNGQIPDHLKQDIIDGKIGSIINEVDVKTINEMQRIALEESRLGIPLIIGRDVIHGFKTVFPIPLGQAATWNPELVKKSAGVAAKEAWSSGVNWTFAPMIDISRDARWGRIAESCGEDPYLTSVMGVAMVEGFQGKNLSDNGTILACAKHFAGYGAAEGGRDYNTTLIPENELRNVYLKSFKAAEEAGVGSFMSGFNDLNGVPATGNRFLLKKVLRDEWNFNGFVVSDWASVTEMISHGFAANPKDAAYKAITAGVDMEMTSESYKMHMKELVDEGKVDKKLLDDAVYRILKIKFDLGLFEDPYVKVEDQNKFALPEYLDVAKKAATQSMVLLKNENHILPLTNNINKVAVIGPMANQKYEQLGTWIFDGDSDLTVTPLEALRSKLGADKVVFAEGLKYTRSKDKADFAQAANTAQQADIVVMCLGEEAILSGEAHCRASIDLPGVQKELLEAVSKAGKPIVLVVMAGRPLAIGEASTYADAVLYAFHPGTMGGPALVDLLMGISNPSAKLPVSFPKSAGQIPIYYNHKNTGRPVDPKSWVCIDDIPLNSTQTSLGNTSHYLDLGFAPLYPFGFGLSYTTFEYKNLSIEIPKVKLGDDVVASVMLENTGNFVGEEVVQLYIRDLTGSVTRPVKELKGFKRVLLKPGESQKVSFKINTSELAFYNQEMEEVTEPGEFYLWIGGSSDARLRADFVVE
uniref:beta-glucosidase BglX n=1 Tax=uncultured Draconibacterium sp. TaxID=1573823 RepID=UPI00321672CB